MTTTALMAAAARAAHLVVDGPPTIFADPLAAPLLGEQADELLTYHRLHGDHVVLSGARAQVVCRSRYTEDRVAEAVGRGVRQYVVLGAGLDTFAYRSPLACGIRVFEVDRPQTQQAKRQRVTAAGVGFPDCLTYVPADLETDPLGACLAEGGFDPAEPAIVSWLGVTMYLTRAAIAGTLAAIGGLAPGTELVADYMVPEALRDAAGHTYVELVAPVTAQRGEPWLTWFSPDDLSGLLETQGLTTVEHTSQHTMVDAALWTRDDALRPSNLTRVVRARVAGSAGRAEHLHLEQ